VICFCKFSCNYVIINGFVAISDVIILFCPVMDDLILCKIDVVGDKCSLTVGYLFW